MTMTMTILTMMTMCDDDGIDIVGKENMTFGFWKWIRNWIRSWKTKQLSDVVSIHSQTSLLAFQEDDGKDENEKNTDEYSGCWAPDQIYTPSQLSQYSCHWTIWRMNGSSRWSFFKWMDLLEAFLGLFASCGRSRSWESRDPPSNKCKYKHKDINEIQIQKWKTHFASCGRSLEGKRPVTKNYKYNKLAKLRRHIKQHQTASAQYTLF